MQPVSPLDMNSLFPLQSTDLQSLYKPEEEVLPESIPEDSYQNLSLSEGNDIIIADVTSVEEVIERKGKEKSRELFEFYRRPLPTTIQSYNRFHRNSTIHKQRTGSSIGSVSRQSIDMHESDMCDDASIVSIKLEPKHIKITQPTASIPDRIPSPKYTIPDDETRINDPNVLEYSLSRRSIAQLAQEANYTVEEIDVLCVNCYKCILLDTVDEHSSTCCKNIASVPEEDEETNIKIRKLVESMKERQEFSVGDKVIYLMQLQEIAHCVIESTLSLGTILNRLERIASNSIVVSEGYSCAIFARRLGNLAEVKCADLPPDEVYVEESVLSMYEEEAARQRLELEKWKLRNELLIQLASSTAEGLSEVRSDLDDRYSVLSFKSCLSSVTDLGNDLGSDFADLKSANEMLDDINEEEQERYFYSLFLRKKYNLSRHHKGRGMSIKESYEDCTAKKIPLNLWEKYIDSILDNLPMS